MNFKVAILLLLVAGLIAMSSGHDSSGDSPEKDSPEKEPKEPKKPKEPKSPSSETSETESKSSGNDCSKVDFILLVRAGKEKETR